MYYDLNVPINDILPNHRLSVRMELMKLGYGCVALNNEIAGNKKPKDASKVTLLPDLDSDYRQKPHVETTALKQVGSKRSKSFNQLKRITLTIDDMNGAHSIAANKNVLNTYDLIAVIPETIRVFQYICEHGEIDIISFDFSSRFPFQLRKPLVDLAMKRSLVFEVSYNAALKDSAARRYFFSNLSNLVRLTGGKNIIFSSGVDRNMLLRAPADIVNIGVLNGLSHGEALDALSTTCEIAIKHAEARISDGININNGEID